MLDALILSDLHLGGANCQTRPLGALLADVLARRPETRRLILNGDLFDSLDFRRLKKAHWKVLSLLRKLAGQLEVVWLAGNHDVSAEVISHLLGVRVADEYLFASGGRQVLVLHGHTFDSFLDDHPWLTWAGDLAYGLLQWLDGSHRAARLAKANSKTFLRCAEQVERGAVRHARRRGAAAVCCGHTHLAVSRPAEGPGGVGYYNSGSWTELPGTYLSVRGGEVGLHHYVLPPEPPAPQNPEAP